MTNSNVSQLNEAVLNKKMRESETKMNITAGWLELNACCEVNVTHCPSPHFTPKDDEADLSLLVVHNISLPPNEFGGDYITDFFLGRLDKNAHPYFDTIYKMEVSAHCLIKRDGSIVQYVSFLNKAWHAGVSCYNGRNKCNDYSIGIELEGADDIAYTNQQYDTLALAYLAIEQEYPNIKGNIAGHNDIAPGRKTDPGESFNWEYFNHCIACKNT